MATTEIILREKVNGLGAEADVVKVKAGFARNYLIPQGKAFEATKANLRQRAALSAARVEREAEEIRKATALSSKINKARLSFTLETGQGGKAFGSITSMDIHSKLEEKGISIDRHSIKLKKPIKTAGKVEIEVSLHTDITATIKVNVETEEKAAE